jgi:hypothetical protein
MTNINEDLGRWFREKWVDISKKDKDGKHPPCGREAASKKHGAYPKCRPSKQVSSDTPETSGEMSKAEKEAAVRQKRKVEKKRRKDKKPHMASHKDIKEAYTPSKEFKGQVLDIIKAKPMGISRKDLMKRMKERYKLVPGIAFEKLLDHALEWWEEGGEIVIMSGLYKVTASVTEETENVPTNPALWSKAKSMAKAKFRVYPSAYANGWAVKWYNDHGGGWNKEDTKESVEIEEATGTQMYALVVKGKIIAKGSKKGMVKAAKEYGGLSRENGVFVGNSPSQKVGDKWNESTDAFQGKRFSGFVAEVADKESMPCNKPRPSTSPGKKRMVKACQDGQEKIVHYGADGYGHNYSAKARSSFRARHNCDQAKDKLSAQYWACKDLWAGKGGSTKGCPGGKDDPDCKY